MTHYKHGGLRRRHVLPVLTPQQVLEVRYLRSTGMCYKLIQWRFDVHRDTLSNAVHGKKAYRVRDDLG